MDGGGYADGNGERVLMLVGWVVNRSISTLEKGGEE